jgi:hypothetical protein
MEKGGRLTIATQARAEGHRKNCGGPCERIPRRASVPCTRIAPFDIRSRKPGINSSGLKAGGDGGGAQQRGAVVRDHVQGRHLHEG